MHRLPPSSLEPQNVAVVTARLKMGKCVITLRPLWSSTSFKNDRFYKHSWSAWFLSWSINIDFSSKTIGFISLFGVPDFWSVRLIFAIVHISKVILNFCYVHGSFDFINISELLYFQWKATHFATFTDSLFWTNFQNLHISKVILKIWPVDGFIELVCISEMLYFLRKTIHFGTSMDSSCG